MTRILIVDDVDTLAQMSQHLEPHGFTFDQVFHTADALPAIATLNPDAVLLDLHFPDDGGDEARTAGGRLLTQIRAQYPHLPVLVWTTRLADPEIPEERFELEPSAKVAKPEPGDDSWAANLAARLRGALEDASWTPERYSRELGFHIGGTTLMAELARQIRLVAPTQESVLIYGEPGTETEAVARALHKLSGRTGRLVVANMRSILEEMTPASIGTRFRALVSAADGGTVFLDAVDDLGPKAHVPLLQVLQEAAGPGSETKADVRLIATAQRDLASLAGGGAFSDDLLIHLSAHELRLPPLRERVDDLPALFYRCVAQTNASVDIPVQPLLRPELAAKLRSYGWPRNIAEFETVIRRAIRTTTNTVLLAADVKIDSAWSASDSPAPADPPEEPSLSVAEAAPEAEGLLEINARRARDTIRVLELLPMDERWELFKNMDGQLEVPAIRELVRTIRSEQGGRRVEYFDISCFLSKEAAIERVHSAIRRFISTRVKVPKIPENQ